VRGSLRRRRSRIIPLTRSLRLRPLPAKGGEVIRIADAARLIPDAIFKQPILRPSLRANGSRERAPDDRLREAIQIWHREIENWTCVNSGTIH